ncbi:MAG TPA: hypothetical protein VF120_14250 [Ktedonobacterales bacterium]
MPPHDEGDAQAQELSRRLGALVELTESRMGRAAVIMQQAYELLLESRKLLERVEWDRRLSCTSADKSAVADTD